MTRLVTSFILALTLAAPTPALAVTDATRRAVKWDVDHAMKWVTVRVRISYYADATSANGGRPPSASEVAAMNAALVRAWEGAPVNCYKLHVILRTDVVSGLAAVPEDSIGIRLIYHAYDEARHGYAGDHHRVFPYTRSFIQTEPEVASNYLSDSPDARVYPTTGTWHVGLNPDDENRLWVNDPRSFNMSHEFGHIIGLEDNYDEHGWREGSAHDLMEDGGDTGTRRLLPVSITKAVRRGGVDFSKLQCSRHLESTPFDMDLHAPFGGIGLSDVTISADNCNWIPPSNDPAHLGDMNVWKGEFLYTPNMHTPDQVAGYTIDPVFQAGGVVVKHPVEFQTVSVGGEEEDPTARWKSWETVKMFDDKNITASADLRLRTIGQPPAAEKFTVHAHFGDSKTGQFAYAANKPLTVEVRDHACQ